MTVIRKLKDENKNFGKYLGGFAYCNNAKKEFLLMTIPNTMKYSQLVERLHSKSNYTYDNIVANLRSYILQLAFKKRDSTNRENYRFSGSKENPNTINRNIQQLPDHFGKPPDMNKSCGYCQEVKQWQGIGHIEAECKTIKWKKEQNTTTTAKPIRHVHNDSDNKGVKSQQLYICTIKAIRSQCHAR